MSVPSSDPAPGGDFDIYLAATPGLEEPLLAEARAAGFKARPAKGGMSFAGSWPDVWRANLMLRGPTRVLARFAQFRAMHLAQLDKRARRVEWAALIPPGTPVRVETTCRKSRIYHAGAATQRIEGAVQAAGLVLSPQADLRIMARIDDDLCTLSLDTSGEPLHKRGHKTWVGKAPLRETMAALLLRQMGYDGTQTVVDPMCGSGSFLLEAADWAANLAPGRSRNFAFERLTSFDPAAWATLKTPAPRVPTQHFYGFDRDTGAIHGATQNAERAGTADHISFRHQPIGDLTPPDTPAGLVMINPPYGARIGARAPLHALHNTLGDRLRQFSGWRIGIVTTDEGLAKTTALPLTPGPYIAHGGLKVRLWQGQL